MLRRRGCRNLSKHHHQPPLACPAWSQARPRGRVWLPPEAHAAFSDGSGEVALGTSGAAAGDGAADAGALLGSGSYAGSLGAGRVKDHTGWKRRWTIVALCFFAFMLCNMDRVNMSIAILPISQQHQWSSTTVGLVQSSFFWGYLLTQVSEPGRRWCHCRYPIRAGLPAFLPAGLPLLVCPAALGGTVPWPHLPLN